MTDQLIPKQPKRKRQPSAELMRQQLALAADEIIRLRVRLSALCDLNADYRVVTLRTRLQIEASARNLRPRIEAVSMYPKTNRPWWKRLLRKAA